MRYVYVLIHQYYIEPRCKEMKYIGAFSSFLKVKKVIKKLRKQVGFQDYKKGFIIRKFISNSCSINLRSVSIKNGNFYSYKKRHIFYLEEDIDLEVDVCDDIKEFGYFSSKSEAKKCFNKIKVSPNYGERNTY